MESNERKIDGPLKGFNDNEESSLVDGALCSKQDLYKSNKSSSSSGSSSKLTVDAVHPFFTSYRNIEKYHCKECNEDFETCPKSLKHHFLGRKHTPVSNCPYCQLPVYEYIHSGLLLHYHRCNEEKIPRPRSEGSGTDVGDNNLNLNSPSLTGHNDISQCSDTINSSLSDVSTDNTSV